MPFTWECLRASHKLYRAVGPYRPCMAKWIPNEPIWIQSQINPYGPGSLNDYPRNFTKKILVMYLYSFICFYMHYGDFCSSRKAPLP